MRTCVQHCETVTLGPGVVIPKFVQRTPGDVKAKQLGESPFTGLCSQSTELRGKRRLERAKHYASEGLLGPRRLGSSRRNSLLLFRVGYTQT